MKNRYQKTNKIRKLFKNIFLQICMPLKNKVWYFLDQAFVKNTSDFSRVIFEGKIEFVDLLNLQI